MRPSLEDTLGVRGTTTGAVGLAGIAAHADVEGFRFWLMIAREIDSAALLSHQIATSNATLSPLLLSRIQLLHLLPSARALQVVSL